jgi:hypothetical protein
MTAVIPFPLTADMRARKAAEANARIFARAVLRSADVLSDETVRGAAYTLMQSDEIADWNEGYHMMRALDAPPVPRADLPPYSAGHGMIRRALVGGFATALVGWIVLVVLLAF